MSTSALAAHCPRGEIWRIHARVCVGKYARQASLPRARARENPAPDPVQQKHVVPEVPSHHGLTFVHVVEPPPDPPKLPPPEIHIPYELPPSRWNHLDVVDFERIGK